MDWCRLWNDMPNDPKWRVIARRSGQELCRVQAVYMHMMVYANQNDDRGSLDGWDDEDVAAALDLDPDDVTAIRDAMEGKVIDGGGLSGWSKRQPVRDDNSAARVKKYREKKALESASETGVTQEATAVTAVTDDVTRCNAGVTRCNAPDTDSEPPPYSPPPGGAGKRGSSGEKRGRQIPDDWALTDERREAALKAGLPASMLATEADKFADYWRAKPGAGGRKLDWEATWRNWCRTAAERRPRDGPAQQHPAFQEIH